MTICQLFLFPHNYRLEIRRPPLQVVFNIRLQLGPESQSFSEADFKQDAHVTKSLSNHNPNSPNYGH